MAHTRSGQIQSSFSGGGGGRGPEKRTRMAGDKLHLIMGGEGANVFRGLHLSGDYTPLMPPAPPGTIDIGSAEQTLL